MAARPQQYDPGLGTRELGNLLAATAAGRAILDIIVPAGDDDCLNRLAAIRDHGCDGVGLGAGAFRVSGVFDVAP